MDYCMRPTGAETSVLTRCFLIPGLDVTLPCPQMLAARPVVVGRRAPTRRVEPGRRAGTAEGVGESVALIKRSHQLCSER